MRKSIFLLLLMAMVLAAVTAGAAEIYQRKVLFTVRYGSSASEIKMAEDESAVMRGPSTFAVDAKGQVLIGSRASRLVKRFSPEGKLLAMVACDAWHLAPDLDGGFYALAEYRSEDGEQRGLKVAHYNSRGKLLSSLFPDFFRDALGNDGANADWPQGIQTDSAGNLYCFFRAKTAMLSPAGKFVGLMPSPYHPAKPECYEFTPTAAAPGGRISVRRLSAKGSELGKFRIKVRAPELGKSEQLFQSFYDEDVSAKALSVSFVDDAGNTYLAGAIEGREPVQLMNGSLRIPGRHIVQKYSPEGTFLTELQFMAEPAGEFPSFFITRGGDIHQIDYLADHLEVIRWAPVRRTISKPQEGVRGQHIGH